MFKNEYFEVTKLSDDSVLIADLKGVPYKWGEKAVQCYCPAHNKDISPFLVVKYSDNTWSLCHAEAGPMEEATKICEKKVGVCPIVFQEDFLDETIEKTNTSNNMVSDVNVQHMMGADKNIENYETMMSGLFVGELTAPKKVISHVGGIPVQDLQNKR